jgi:hypothetical protein
MTNTLLFAPYSLWTHHFATDLELAVNCLEEGDTVTWVECRGELGVCDLNPDAGTRPCSRCISRRDYGIELAQLDVRRVTIADLLDRTDSAALDSLPQRFETAESLRSYRFMGFDAGFAAHSSTVWIAKDSDIDLSAHPHAERVRGFMRSGCGAYLAARRLLQKEHFDQAFLFNGRMAPMRGAFRALREAGVDTWIHERGCDPAHYSLSQNALPHEIAPMEKRIRQAWESSTLLLEERVSTANEWFERRAAGEATSWHSFTRDQAPAQLPECWNSKQHNIAIFTTSEYEFAAISDEWNNPLFASNAEAVLHVIKECRQLVGVTVYVRMHPNLAGLANAATEQLRALAGENVHIIEPESKISTYALAEQASKVVVTGSSVGIEAAVHGRPVILVGRCYYESLGAVHAPRSEEELHDLLADRALGGLDPLGGHMYGFFMARFGHRFARFTPSGLFGGVFDGEELRSPRWRRRMARLRLNLLRMFSQGRA